MTRCRAILFLIVSVSAFSALAAYGSDRMKRFIFKPGCGMKISDTEPVLARRLLSEAEYWNSPWIRELEKVLSQSVKELDSHPEQGFSNVSFSCLLDQNGKLTDFVPVGNTKEVDASANEKGIAFLQNCLKNRLFSAPKKPKVKIVIHFYQSYNFGIEQESP